MSGAMHPDVLATARVLAAIRVELAQRAAENVERSVRTERPTAEEVSRDVHTVAAARPTG